MYRLFVVPTPIGNLEDMTFRAVRVLHEVSLILAEDTRQTRKLLTHYGISKRLLSYHQHNKLMRLESVFSALAQGDVALVSSAGMPAVADPGFELIRAAIDRGVSVEVLPGASAVVTAIVAAALPAPGFLFAGFLPRKRAERRRRLEELRDLPYSLVFYEAPHRLIETLVDARSVLTDRPAVAARELTKLHQEVIRSTLAGLIERFEQVEPRGEFTLVIGGGTKAAANHTAEALQDLRQRQALGQSGRVAVREVADRFGLPRNEVYRLWLTEVT